MTIKAYMLRNAKIRLPDYFFSRSRISVSNFSSLLGSGGAGAGAGTSFRIILFIALIIMNMANATIRKSMVVCIKAP